MAAQPNRDGRDRRLRGLLTGLLPARPPAGTAALVGTTGVLAVGKGVLLTTLVVYLLRVARVSALDASVSMSLWGVAAIVVSVPAGIVADRWSPRLLGLAGTVLAAPAVALVGLAGARWLLMVLIALAGALDGAGGVARRALLAAAGDGGVSALAWARTTSNAGFAIGAVLSIPLLASRSAGAYAVAYVLAGLAYLVMAACLAMAAPTTRAAREPAASGTPARRGRLWAATALAGSTAILSLHVALLDVAFPIWIVEHTSVPAWVLGWLVLLNTVITVAGQIPAGHRAGTLAGALRCSRASAVWVAASCVLLCTAAFGAVAWQVCALVLAMLALTVGELLQSAGEWGLSAVLAADEGEHGFYQGACVFGESAQSAAGPVLVGGLLTALPVAGWGVLIVLLAVGRAVATGVVREGRLDGDAPLGSEAA